MSAPKTQHVVVGFFLHPYLDLFCGRAGPHLARLLPAHPLAHAHQALQARSAPLHEGPAGKVELVLVPVGQRSEVGKARRLALKCRCQSHPSWQLRLHLRVHAALPGFASSAPPSARPPVQDPRCEDAQMTSYNSKSSRRKMYN